MKWGFIAAQCFSLQITQVESECQSWSCHLPSITLINACSRSAIVSDHVGRAKIEARAINAVALMSQKWRNPSEYT